MHTAWVISIGTELTLGQTVDTNGAWLATRLAGLGLRATRHVTVPDEADAIRAVLLEAAAASDAVVVSGGLGPTADDLTRAALAAAAGVPLELHGPSLERIRAYFAARNRVMPETNTNQALVPKTGEAIDNLCGTAPGLAIKLGGTPCFVMPGVPHEMRAMFERDVAPRLRAATGGAIVLSRRLNTFGLGESDLGHQIRDLMERGRNPEVGTTAELGVIGIRINATAQSVEAATRMLDDTEAELRRRFGEIVFGRGDDTLASVVGEKLLAVGATLCTAESCTGGLIGAMLTDVAGSSRYFVGGAISYANEAKAAVLGVPAALLGEHGAVSEPVARAMADGAARVFGAPYALSATGIAGPGGGTAAKPVGLVFIGLRTPAGTQVWQFHFGTDAAREVVRVRAARTALNHLRLALR